MVAIVLDNIYCEPTMSATILNLYMYDLISSAQQSCEESLYCFLFMNEDIEAHRGQ